MKFDEIKSSIRACGRPYCARGRPFCAYVRPFVCVWTACAFGSIPSCEFDLHIYDSAFTDSNYNIACIFTAAFK